MKSKTLLITAISLFAFTSLSAVDLKNEDSTTYEVKIHSVGTTNSSIGSSTTQLSVCSSCTIEVVGVGSVEVSGSQTVVIRNGQLSVQ